MYKKIRFTILNIFLLCFAFGIMFFIKIKSFASPNPIHITYHRYEGGVDSYSDVSNYVSNHDGYRYAIYVENIDNLNPYRLSIVSLYNNTPYDWDSTRHYSDGSTSYDSGNSTYSGSFNSTYNVVVSFVGGCYSYSVSGCPIFNDLADASQYVIDGTLPEKPFNDMVKLDKFKVYMKGEWNWDFVRPQFNNVVVCPIWSNPDINDVEISIYAVDPSFRYNTVNYSYDGNMSGQMQSLDISGLTLHGQKFVVRATPFTSTFRGVAIQYEFTFPENFDQPIGQLVIPSDNTYPYSTTIDISGNDVPIEWTVTQTPIYVYETNNIENYYYGDTVSYPVPEITENTENNYYETYINNYYNTYNEVVNNYDVNFDIDISDVSSGDIQQTYDDFGNFFKGFGGFIGKLALLFSGLFPFLSPLVATTLVAMVGIIVLGAIVILFLKVLHIL